MRIYHLASFSGNIGDAANHYSFYEQFKNKIYRNPQITQEEIRDYYKNAGLKRFDESFVDEVNQHDLFVFGGGNFFEICWDYSENGTTFNISNELLKKIKVPILINGIGIDDNKGAKKENIEKFRKFLDTLFTYNNVFFTVRNDGSYEIFNKYYPEYVDRIMEIPDFGFFVSEIPTIKRELPSQRKAIGFNIALDMPNIRFAKTDYKTFIRTTASQIDQILEHTEYHVYLFAHIQSDYQAILDVLEYVKNKQARTRISITALMIGRELENFVHYKDCDMVFAMRFHANICAISLGIPTFGIVAYPKHKILYDKIGLPHRRCSLDQDDFVMRFNQEVQQIIKLDSDYLSRLREEYELVIKKLSAEKDRMLDSLHQWLLPIPASI